jgi:hypothetical protein
MAESTLHPAIDAIKTFHEALMPEINAISRKLLDMQDFELAPIDEPVLDAALELIKTFNETKRAGLETIAATKKPRVKKAKSDKTKK